MKVYPFLLAFASVLALSSCKDKLVGPPNTPTSDTIAYWTFDGNAQDVSGNGRNATITGNSRYIKDRFTTELGIVDSHTAIEFDGSGQMNVTNMPVLNDNDSYTISVWASFSPGGSLISQTYGFAADTLGWGADLAGSGQIESNTSVGANRWHLLTLAVAAHSSATLYIDSVQVAQKQYGSYSGDNSNQPLQILFNATGISNIDSTRLDDALMLHRCMTGNEVAVRFHEGGWYSHKDGTTTRITGWVKGSFQTPDDIEALWFAWHDTVYACGFNGSILRSIDGGANWVKQVSGTTNNLYRIRFLNFNMGYAGGNAGTLLWTQNAGINWNPVPGTLLTTNDNIRDLYCGGHSIIAVGGNSNSGFIITSTDDGKTWTKSVVTGIASFYGVAKITNVGFIAVGSQGQVYKTTDPSLQSWTPISVSGNPNFESICCSSGGFIWAGTFDGVIYGSSDGGITWPQRNSITTGQIRTLYTVSDQNVWAAGDNGVIVHSIDGGLTWQREDRSDFSGQWNNIELREPVQQGEKRMIGLAGQSGEYYYYLF